MFWFREVGSKVSENESESEMKLNVRCRNGDDEILMIRR